MNVDFLSPMMIKDSKKLVFMNFSEGKVYGIDVVDSNLVLVEIDQNTATGCFDDLDSQRKEMTPEMPIEQIRKVLGTERELTKQNEDHVFRRQM